MKKLLMLTALLALAAPGCAEVTFNAKTSAVFDVTEEVLRGEEDCNVRIAVDGGRRSVVVKAAPGIKCPLPAHLLAPKE